MLALQQDYAYSIPLQWDSLYREFHLINFLSFKGDLASFNATFSSLIAKLALAKVIINLID